MKRRTQKKRATALLERAARKGRRETSAHDRWEKVLRAWEACKAAMVATAFGMEMVLPERIGRARVLDGAYLDDAGTIHVALEYDQLDYDTVFTVKATFEP